MMMAQDSTQPPPEGGSLEHTPRPTYAPAALALAIMFTVWGITTHWTMSVAGLGLMAWALGTWINEIRNEWNE